MESDFSQKLLKLEDFPFIKAFMGELGKEFYNEMIL